MACVTGDEGRDESLAGRGPVAGPAADAVMGWLVQPLVQPLRPTIYLPRHHLPPVLRGMPRP